MIIFTLNVTQFPITTIGKSFQNLWKKIEALNKCREYADNFQFIQMIKISFN
jgi:hypothetical protein